MMQCTLNEGIKFGIGLFLGMFIGGLLFYHIGKNKKDRFK